MIKYLDQKNASAYEYLASASSQLEEIYKPLSYLGISYFSYIKIFKNNKY